MNQELFDAASAGDVKAVRAALAAGADIAYKDNEERTPLHNAATQGHAAVIALLLDEGIDVNVMNYTEWTPLHCAASSFELDCVKLLLKRGANSDAKTLAGESPLHLAATPNLCEGDKREADAVLKALLDHDKKNIDALNKEKMTALMKAAKGGEEACVKLLLARGADKSLGKKGVNAASHARAYGHEAVVKLLGEEM